VSIRRASDGWTASSPAATIVPTSASASVTVCWSRSNTARWTSRTPARNAPVNAGPPTTEDTTDSISGRAVRRLLALGSTSSSVRRAAMSDRTLSSRSAAVARLANWSESTPARARTRRGAPASGRRRRAPQARRPRAGGQCSPGRARAASGPRSRPSWSRQPPDRACISRRAQPPARNRATPRTRVDRGDASPARRIDFVGRRRGRDSNPRTRSTPVTRFPIVPVQPLRHLSSGTAG
jgi:hypothetical protein